MHIIKTCPPAHCRGALPKQTGSRDPLLLSFLLLSLLLCFSINGSAKQKKIIVPVAGDNVNIRNAPSLNSKVVCSIRLITYVQIIKTQPGIVQIGNLKGRWTFVQIHSSLKHSINMKQKGWIFDYYLGYQWKFKRVYKWRRSYLENHVGDSYSKIDIFPDGGVNILGYSTYEPDGQKPGRPMPGFLYRFRKLFMIKYSRNRVWGYYRLDRDGLIHDDMPKWDNSPNREILLKK